MSRRARARRAQKVVRRPRAESANRRYMATIPPGGEAVRRRRGDLVIAETAHGSSARAPGSPLEHTRRALVVLLPEVQTPPPVASAQRWKHDSLAPSVRPSALVRTAWRRGRREVAIGGRGMAPLRDLRGTADRRGYILQTTLVAVADEVLLRLVSSWARRRGFRRPCPRRRRPGRRRRARDLVMPPELDLFR